MILFEHKINRSIRGIFELNAYKINYSNSKMLKKM